MAAPADFFIDGLKNFDIIISSPQPFPSDLCLKDKRLRMGIPDY